jgi:hypothetical protein
LIHRYHFDETRTILTFGVAAGALSAARNKGYLLAKAYVPAQNATRGGVSASSDRSACFTAAISLPQRIIYGSSSFSAATRYMQWNTSNCAYGGRVLG